jgi:preprotein translocase subunit SecB
MVCEENQMGVLTKKRLWIKDILLERVHEYHPYDAMSHRKIVRKINTTNNELKELQFEYKTLKSEVMFKSEEAEVLKAATPLGLKISRETPQRLKVK